MQSVRIKCVGAILRNQHGQILLQQRDNKPGLLFPNCWTTFGGQIEHGESPDDAMRRELLEEIELAPDMTLWKVFEHTQRSVSDLQVTVEQYVYVGEIDREVSEIMLNEGQALGFFSLEDIDTLPIAFGFESLFRAYFEMQAAGGKILPKMPCVSAILTNSRGQVLMQQRDSTRDIAFPNMWAMFGGRVETGELPEDAIRRELIEELELELDAPLDCWKAYERLHSEGHITILQYIFVGQVADNARLVLHEGQAMGFFDPAALEDLQIAFGFDVILREYFTRVIEV